MHRSILIQLRLLSVRHREWERLKLTARSKCVRERKMRDAAGEKQHATTLRRMSARAKLHGTNSPLSESKLRSPTTPTTPTTPISKLRQISQISSPERITCKVGHPVGHLNRFQSLTVQRLADLNFSTSSALPQSMHPLQRRLAHKNVFANEQHPQWLAMHIRWSHQWHAGSFLKGEWTQSMQSATNLEAVNRFLPRHPQKPQTKGNC